ncbi:MAG: MCE family protein [Bacteroidia bacterium]|nr:MlaD family protein [Bacteroidia bacterium]MCC6768022.1 MCE family protein [Bacteroidia bacterium]
MNIFSKLSKEARTGIIVLAAIAMFYFGINYLKGVNIFSPARSFYAVFDNADFLLPSAPVTINGLQVGVVEDVYFADGASNKVVVRLRVSNRDLKIPSDTRAHIKSDLLGTRTMYLEVGRSDKLLGRGDTLTGILDSAFTDQLTTTILPLKDKVESLVVSIDSVLGVIRGVFNHKTQQGLVVSFESINRSVLKLEHTVNEVDLLVGNERTKLGDIFTNIRSITENIRLNNDKLTNVFSNLDKITDDLARSNVSKTMADLQQSVSSLQQVMQRIEKGEGTIGQLMTNDSLFHHLDGSAKSLDRLLEDMRLHPNRYVHFSVFGRKEKSK